MRDQTLDRQVALDLGPLRFGLGRCLPDDDLERGEEFQVLRVAAGGGRERADLLDVLAGAVERRATHEDRFRGACREPPATGRRAGRVGGGRALRGRGGGGVTRPRGGGGEWERRMVCGVRPPLPRGGAAPAVLRLVRADGVRDEQRVEQAVLEQPREIGPVLDVGVPMPRAAGMCPEPVRAVPDAIHLEGVELQLPCHVVLLFQARLSSARTTRLPVNWKIWTNSTMSATVKIITFVSYR